jgi:hypothetical protein
VILAWILLQCEEARKTICLAGKTLEIVTLDIFVKNEEIILDFAFDLPLSFRVLFHLFVWLADVLRIKYRKICTIILKN